MASPTQWTWVWTSFRIWRWTGKPGVLPSMRSQRVRCDWATELILSQPCQQKVLSYIFLIFCHHYSLERHVCRPLFMFFCMSFSPGFHQKVKVLVTQSCPTLPNPMDCSPPGSSVYGISPGKNTGWVTMPIFSVKAWRASISFFQLSELTPYTLKLRVPEDVGVTTVWADLLSYPAHCCSVAQSCMTLCRPIDCSMPGLPVPHHLPKFAQVQVHCISDAIQPSHPLTLSSPSALILSLLVTICIWKPKVFRRPFHFNVWQNSLQIKKNLKKTNKQTKKSVQKVPLRYSGPSILYLKA